MDIKLKMGAKASLPSSKNKGTVYFAKDGNKNFGELYYDDENGNRVKVGGTNLSSISFNTTGVMTLSFEDGTSVTGTLPKASGDTYGIIDNGAQSFNGVKTFTNGIVVSKISFINSGDIEPIENGLSIYKGKLQVKDGNFSVDASSAGNTATLSLSAATGLWTQSLGSSSNIIPAAYIEELNSSTIKAAQFQGAFVGDLEGTAKDAGSWTNSITLNDTQIKGGEKDPIITNKWGVARNISISSTATDTTNGTSIDGSSEDGYILFIPKTMVGFTSITSTNLLATNLGSTSTPVEKAHLIEGYLYNSSNKNYYHKLTSNASSSSYNLQLPNISGLLIAKENPTAAVGSLNTPVFVDATGKVTACNIISVGNGGTGVNSLPAGSILIGNGTNSVGTVSATTKGLILVANGTNNAPIYASPSLSFSTGPTNPKLSLTINDTTYTTAVGIQVATGENPGIVSTGEQTFSGKKIFSGAVNFQAGITSTTGTFSGQINATSDIKLSGQLKSNSSGSSFMTLTDTKATLTSPTVYLNGTTIVLNSSNYGATLPTTNLEEGRIFFLLT